MAKRLVKKTALGFKTMYDVSLMEYEVIHPYNVNANYFTNDREDALETMEQMEKEYMAKASAFIAGAL